MEVRSRLSHRSSEGTSPQPREQLTSRSRDQLTARSRGQEVRMSGEVQDDEEESDVSVTAEDLEMFDRLGEFCILRSL